MLFGKILAVGYRWRRKMGEEQGDDVESEEPCVTYYIVQRHRCITVGAMSGCPLCEWTSAWLGWSIMAPVG